MIEQLISFKTAKLAKEKGFDWKCRGRIHCSHYHLVKDNIIPINVGTNNNEIFAPFKNHNKHFENGTQTYTSLPTQSLLQKWLREVHNIHFEIKPIFDVPDNLKPYHISILKNPSGKGFEFKIVGTFDTYEETLEIGLQKALKLIK